MKKQMKRRSLAVRACVVCAAVALVVSAYVCGVDGVVPFGLSGDTAVVTAPEQRPAFNSESGKSHGRRAADEDTKAADTADERSAPEGSTSSKQAGESSSTDEQVRVVDDGLDDEDTPEGVAGSASESTGATHKADAGDANAGSQSSATQGGNARLTDVNNASTPTDVETETGERADESASNRFDAVDVIDEEEPLGAGGLADGGDIGTFVMPAGAECEPDEILLSVDPSASVEEVEALLASIPGIAPQSVDAEELSTGLLAVALEPGTSVEDGVNAALAASSDVVTGSQPNYVYYLADDSSGENLWARLNAAAEVSALPVDEGAISGGAGPVEDVDAVEEDGVVEDADTAEVDGVVEEDVAAEGEDATDVVATNEGDVQAAVDPAPSALEPDTEVESQAEAAQGIEAQADAVDEGVSLQERLAAVINDPLASEQWALTSMRAYEAWAISTCEGAVSVAVLDSGFEVGHEDFADNVVAGSGYNAWAASEGEGDTTDVSPISGKDRTHGMHVAGIVGAVANNGIGVAGVSHNARIVPIKVFSDDSSSSTLALRRAYDYLIAHAEEYGIKLVNISVGMAVKDDNFEDDAFFDAVRKAFAHGIVTVAASCNTGTRYSSGGTATPPFYAWPSDSESIVGVINVRGSASTAGNDASGAYSVSRSSTSNYNVTENDKCQSGPSTRKGKNISAPGADILSTVPGGVYTKMSGTSMASPSIAGVMALEFAANPDLTADAAVDILYASAHDIGDEGWDAECGHGEADAAEAVRMAKSGGVTTKLNGGGEVVARLVLSDGYYTYDGAAKEPEAEVTITDAEGSQTSLTNGTDYVVTYVDNTNAGVATAIVTGAGTYEGVFEQTLHFTIARRALTEDMVGLSRGTGTNGAWPYDARPLRPQITLKDGGRIGSDGAPRTVTLARNTDYTINYSYEHNQDVGTGVAHINVSGVGNYMGELSVLREFTIEPRDVNYKKITAEVEQHSFYYDGMAHESGVRLTHERTTAVDGDVHYELVKDKDYTLEYGDDVHVGIVPVKVTGIGNYTGERTETFDIVPAVLAEDDAITVEESYLWSGKAIEPEVIVVHGSRRLTKDTDYTLSYEDNTEVGTAKAVVTGIGNYQGTTIATFHIIKHSLEEAVMSVTGTYTYTGKAIKPLVTVTFRDVELEEGTDYVLSFADNTAAGRASATATGMGPYGDSISAQFSILRKKIAMPKATNRTYTGKEQVGVAGGTGYVLSGTARATNVGSYKATATPDANHRWTDGSTEAKTIAWSIVKASNPLSASAGAASQSVAYSATATRTLASNVKVTGAQGAVTYANASTNATAKKFSVNASTGKVGVPKGIAVGTYTVMVKASAVGNANYKAGSKTVSFAVEVKRASLDKASVATVSARAYTGKAIRPTPTVKLGGMTLKLGTDYTVGYQNNVKAGNATITMTGKGSYTGSCTATFRIVAPTVYYRVHRQTYGWETTWVKNGGVSGTTGESKRLEGIRIKLGAEFPVSGGIAYRTHVQTYGWESVWAKDGSLSGTTGESKRLEAIEIKLTGAMAEKYDVWYRVHAQTYGWMGWAKNGARAGTAGQSKRLEAIQIKLVPKGQPAPGRTTGSYVEK